MQSFYKVFLAAIIFFIVFGYHALSQEKLKSDGEMPILAWVGVPESETTVERFKELKESGININFVGYSGVDAVERALDIAQKAGIKLQVSCPELRSEPEKTVKRLMKHPALAGYHLKDEPNATDFAELGAWIKRIQAVDSKHYSYVNLFPNYAAPKQLFDEDYQLAAGKNIYVEHVDTFLKQVPVPFISFDHYPITEKNGVRYLRPQFYKNLNIIASAAQKNKIPFWAFTLSVAHGHYPLPTIGEMKLQLYSNLAYGAQGLQYFTYWTPSGILDYDYHEAPIGGDGKRTIVYDRIKLINGEIQNLASVFLNAKVISVGHTGKLIPDGTIRMDKLPRQIKLLETGDSGAIVSILEKDTRRFMVIVNRDFQNPMKFTILTDDTVKRVLKDGTLVKAYAYTHTLELDPGDMIVYTWENGK